ncbi:glutamine amidotransferase [Halomonas sp. V046]|uniref:glutamine amidotransferase n=1 Tax=Halomonas sp. V046 TaxID=3459611 RepID=UPI0040444DEE
MRRLAIFKTGDSFADVISHHGDFDALFLAALSSSAGTPGTTPPSTPLDIDVFDVRDDACPLPPWDAIDGVMITGSHAMVSDREVWSEALKPWLCEAKARQLPMFGVCYGHQLMAAAFGGDSGYHPAGRECGTHNVRLTKAARDDELFGELPPHFGAHLTHSQSVLALPAAATVLAANDHDPHQALRYGPRQWSVQFHPEFTPAVMRAYLEHQRDAIDAQGDDVASLLAGVNATPVATSLLARFAELVVAAKP